MAAAAANADSGGYRRTARRLTEFDGLTSGRQLPAPRTAYLIELQNSIRAAAVLRGFAHSSIIPTAEQTTAPTT